MCEADRWGCRLKRGQPLRVTLQVFPQGRLQNGGALKAWHEEFPDLHHFAEWQSTSGSAFADT